MVAFTPVVQADLSGTAFGGAPTWTDLTRFARLGPSPIRITKWRQDQLSDIAPSTMQIVFDNADLPGDATAPNGGRFTPFLPSSPWFPQVLPGVRIRAGVTVNAVAYWRFDGYVDVWDASYDNGEFGICTVSASDILARLGAMDVLRTIYVEECLVDRPILLYPLTEPAGSTQAADISGYSRSPLIVGQTLGGGDHTFGAATGIPTDSSGTLQLNSTLTSASGDDDRGDFLYSPSAFTVAAQPAVSFEVWATVNSSMLGMLSRFSPATFFYLYSPTGSAWMGLRYVAGAIKVDTGVAGVGPDLNDGHLHHLVLTITAGNTATWYVDGVAVGTFARSLYTGGLSQMWVGSPSRPELLGENYQVFRGGVGYVAAYPTALSAGRVLAHYNAGVTAFAGEGTSTHLARLLSYRTNLGSTLDSGQGTVSVHAISGATEQQALLDTARAEGGLLYADPASGKVVFLDRTRLRNPVSMLTLDVTAQQTTGDLNVRADRDLLVNDATISRPSGASQRRTDTTSKNTYGTKGVSDTWIIGSDADAANAAGWLVANGKDVRARTPALTVDLLTEPSTAIATAVLGLTPLQRVTLANPPASMAVSDVIVQGCTDTIGVDVFECALSVGTMPRQTLRFDAAADSFTKLDSGNVFAW